MDEMEKALRRISFRLAALEETVRSLQARPEEPETELQRLGVKIAELGGAMVAVEERLRRVEIATGKRRARRPAVQGRPA